MRVTLGPGTLYGITTPTPPGAQRGFDAGEATVVAGSSVSDTAGRPNGYEGGDAWLMPRRGGGLSAYTTLEHGHALSAGLASGVNVTTSLISDGSVSSAQAQALANLISSMTAANSLSASMQAFANLAAELAATGGTAASMQAFANLSADLTATGELSGPDLTLIVGLVCSMLAHGDVSSSLTLLVGVACSMVSAGAVSGAAVAHANLASTLLAAGDLSGAMSVLSYLSADLISSNDLDGQLRGTLTMAAAMTTSGIVGEPPTATEIATAVWQFLLSGVSAGDALTRTAPTTAGSVISYAGNTASAFRTDLTETVADHWKDAIVSFSSGALLGQVKRVIAYDGTTKLLTVSGGFTSAPETSATFILVNR